MPQTLMLESPFWEDQATLTIAGDAEDEVLFICAEALRAAGYQVLDVEDEESV